MTILEKINKLTYFSEIIKLKDILKELYQRGGESLPYKTYVAQFGISQITEDKMEYTNVFENTIGDITITKAGSQFFIESDNLFTTNKTFVNITGGGDSVDSIVYLGENITTTSISFFIYGSGQNSNNHVEIRVYN
jgi:hypothetical protein